MPNYNTIKTLLNRLDYPPEFLGKKADGMDQEELKLLVKYLWSDVKHLRNIANEKDKQIKILINGKPHTTTRCRT